MVLEEEESVLIREVSLFQGCPYRGVQLYLMQWCVKKKATPRWKSKGSKENLAL